MEPAQVQILWTEPNKEYDMLGDIFESNDNMEDLFDHLQTRALKMGGNAIIVTRDEGPYHNKLTETSINVTINNNIGSEGARGPLMESGPDRIIWAKVIRIP
jgi:hypothetical protein